MQKRKWIPERQENEQFPGWIKKYSFDSGSFRLFWMRPFWIIFRVRLFDPSLVKALENLAKWILSSAHFIEILRLDYFSFTLHFFNFSLVNGSLFGVRYFWKGRGKGPDLNRAPVLIQHILYDADNNEAEYEDIYKIL